MSEKYKFLTQNFKYKDQIPALQNYYYLYYLNNALVLGLTSGIILKTIRWKYSKNRYFSLGLFGIMIFLFPTSNWAYQQGQTAHRDLMQLLEKEQ